MRIASALVCLTLFGCEANPGSHSASSNKNTPLGVEVAATDTKADNTAGDDAGKDGANNGSTDTGSDTAPNKVDTSTTTAPPAKDPCQSLQYIAGTWYRIGGGGQMTVTLVQEGNTCAVTTKGEGALDNGGTLHGTELPLEFQDEGWEISLHLKKELLVQSLKDPNANFAEVTFYR